MSKAARDDYGISGDSEGLKSTAQAAKDAVLEASRRTSDAAGDILQGVKAGAGSTVSTLRDQASQAADEAKSTIAAVADEARLRLGQMVEDQKAAGADQVAGMARAAHAAAGDLRQTSPQLAQLVENAAGHVETMAESIRASSVGDIIGSLTQFGRRRPLALFGGAVAAGFLFARFIKSDAPSVATSPGSRRV